MEENKSYEHPNTNTFIFQSSLPIKPCRIKSMSMINLDFKFLSFKSSNSVGGK